MVERNKYNVNDPITTTNNNHANNNRVIWDCGSTLYDSFELNSLQKQLNSAIISSSRTFSMPRLPSHNNNKAVTVKKPTGWKISRTFQKILRSVFPRPKSKYNDSSSSCSDPWLSDSEAQTFCDDQEAKRVGSLVGKTMSCRFNTASVNNVGIIYCA